MTYFRQIGWAMVLVVVVLAVAAAFNPFFGVLGCIASFFFGAMYVEGKYTIERSDAASQSPEEK